MSPHDPETLDVRHRERTSGAVAGAIRRARAAAPVSLGPKTESEHARDAEERRWLLNLRHACADVFCGHPRCDRRREIDRRKAEPAAKEAARVCGFRLPGRDAYGEPRRCGVRGPCRWHPEGKR